MNRQADLDYWLIEWHHWARGWRPTAEPTCGSMWRGVKSSRQWEDTMDIADRNQHAAAVKLIDFCVNEMNDVYRTALQLQARNLATGRQVWTSPRLPNDLESRAQLLGLARQALMCRLASSGLIE